MARNVMGGEIVILYFRYGPWHNESFVLSSSSLLFVDGDGLSKVFFSIPKLWDMLEENLPRFIAQDRF